ncbi:insulin-like growth factor-binding protein-related protein 1 [Haliotis rufescens]|uniref:insulin-like growth factor-binding protein-related protein 1 n=1 Tax=Haliotis rufescens TaxID=6454 RepID=UPI001EAFC53F|nr:insulin-like growth factor-binding protein-related protein 1 [Haliotis rufescens]
MNSLWLVALLGLVVVCNAGTLKGCGECDRSACPSVSCLAGKTQDECKCCEICLKMEGEECNHKLKPEGYGDCGTGLKCSKVDVGHYCLCETDEIICGKDGVTYNNVCQMFAAEARSGKKIQIKKSGPCEPGATIVTPPEFTRNYTGGSVVLSCEAVGNPTPNIAWLFTRVDGKSFSVPGDDQYMLTAARGGPGAFQITGWLQIEGLKKSHEGDYTCVAKNSESKDYAKARIKVVDGSLV